MEKYTYKDSGIEWLGDIPEHWIIDRIKDNFIDDLSQINEKKLKEIENVAHYSIPAFDDGQTPHNCEGESISSGKKVLKGTGLLYSKLNCWKPRVWKYKINDNDFLSVASTEFIGLRPIHYSKIHLTYFEYLLGSVEFTNSVKIFLTSVTNSHQRITPNKFDSQNIPLPPFQEQKAIAEYLDKAIAKIDRIIAIKQEQLVKMKENTYSLINEFVTGKKTLKECNSYKSSDIEWLGNIPEHWKVDRLKDVCERITGGGTPKSSISEYWDDGDIIWISPTDFGNQKGTKYITNSEKKITELGVQKSSAKFLPEGTVIMSSRASIGEPKIAGKEVTTNQGFISYISNYRLHNNFLFYCIEGQLGSYFQSIASGTTFMEISRRMASVENIPLPPIQEQKAIAEHLDESITKIKKIESFIKFQIETLQAYRKSLIHECVTGKKQIASAIKEQTYA